MSSYLTDGSVDLSPDDTALTEAGILVVDEDPAFQLGLKTFLKEYVGFEKVFTARNGREAIELIDQEPSIELLTVDYQMPEMDGLELLEHLQENTPRPLGVTMITGFPSDELKRQFASRTSSKLLTNHFLSKPVEFEKLEPIILDCYEELKRSQQLTQTMTGEFEEEPNDLQLQNAALAEANRELLAKFDLLDEKLENTNKAIKDLKKSNAMRAFWSDLLKLIIIGALALMAWQGGWIEKGWAKMKALPIFSSAEEKAPQGEVGEKVNLPEANRSNAKVDEPKKVEDKMAKLPANPEPPIQSDPAPPKLPELPPLSTDPPAVEPSKPEELAPKSIPAPPIDDSKAAEPKLEPLEPAKESSEAVPIPVPEPEPEGNPEN